MNSDKQAEAAAPTDAEIEAWRATWERRFRGDGLELGEDAALLEEAVALMRRARAAPPSGALREAAMRLCDPANHKDKHPDHPDDPAILLLIDRRAWNGLRAALAAEPEAKPAGVVVPDDVREVAREVSANYSKDLVLARQCADWILSLPAAAQPAASHESLAEEVARLHGFVGPDGRGRP